MKNLLLPAVVLLVIVSGCKHENKEADDAFKQTTIAECQTAFKKFYASDFDANNVKVINSSEVIDWIDKSPWKDRELPCEIKEVLARDKGNTDPSPIALDLSGSAPEKDMSLIYVPIRGDVNCELPKSGFFLDDTGKGCEKVMVCDGEIGKKCTCSCTFACDATETLCKDTCPN